LWLLLKCLPLKKSSKRPLGSSSTKSQSRWLKPTRSPHRDGRTLKTSHSRFCTTVADSKLETFDVQEELEKMDKKKLLKQAGSEEEPEVQTHKGEEGKEEEGAPSPKRRKYSEGKEEE
jgi:hypothetical protein